MFVYTKLYDLLTGRHGVSGRPPLKCSVKELYGKNDKLKYIYFHTENGVPCLLNIPEKHEVKMDTRKFLNLIDWVDDSSGLNSVLAADTETSIVKKIRSTSSPLGYVQFLKKIKPSLESIPYTIAIMVEEFLIVTNSDDIEEISIYPINGSRDKKLLIVMELETLLFKNIVPEIERVHKNVIKLIKEDSNEYWDSLLKLLQKCKDVKIISKGRETSERNNFIEESVKLFISHNAVKTALEHFE